MSEEQPAEESKQPQSTDAVSEKSTAQPCPYCDSPEPCEDTDKCPSFNCMVSPG